MQLSVPKDKRTAVTWNVNATELGQSLNLKEHKKHLYKLDAKRLHDLRPRKQLCPDSHDGFLFQHIPLKKQKQRSKTKNKLRLHRAKKALQKLPHKNGRTVIVWKDMECRNQH